MTDEDDEVEDRAERLEAKVGDARVADLEDRLAAIERHQKRLESTIERLARRTRQKSEEIPHIESVRQLYQALEAIEADMRRVGETVDELTVDTDK